MARPYPGSGGSMGQASSAQGQLVAALQVDLRRLGYLDGGIDGQFGAGTTRAVRALQFDLLHANAAGTDGNAPVAIPTYNRGRVTAVSGEVDEGLAACIDDMLADSAFLKVPEAVSADEARSRNAAAVQAVAAMTGAAAPVPFMLAIFRQESDCRHYCVPTASDPDGFVIVGLDRNDQHAPDHVTSRGWGLGQFTLFHHPPTAREANGFITDPAGNVSQAFAELRDKFDNFVLPNAPGLGADERRIEIPAGTGLRLCRYQPADPKYMTDCKACAVAARKVDIHLGTPAYAGAPFGYTPTQYYSHTDYSGIPDRSDFGCDWPYAVRRYNGSGINSFHYQTRVLQNLLTE